MDIDLLPDGAVRFYEGNDPAGFAREIRERFGLDVEADPFWSKDCEGKPLLAFTCPEDLLDAIYWSSDYPLGS